MFFKKFHIFNLTESNFDQSYDMPENWWKDWKSQNGEKYKFFKNSKTNSYEVKDENGNVILVYDYKRIKVFTDKSSKFLELEPEEIK